MENQTITPKEYYILFDIFLHSISNRTMKLRESQKRLVHYTSATSGMSILNSQELWMGNLADMNDYKEVHYGRDLFLTLTDQLERKNYPKMTLSNEYPFSDLIQTLQFISKRVMRLAENKRWESYITCFSEHEDSEDQLGRLSMWRGYGKDGGVAFVFKSDTLLQLANYYQFITIPIEYLDINTFRIDFEKWETNLDKNKAILIEIWNKNSSEFMRIFNFCMEIILMSIKHPGFKEEKEWRLVSSILDNDPKELKDDIVIKGYPRVVKKFPLMQENQISISNILDRIIIGPNSHANQVYFAYIKKLAELKVEDPVGKVFISEIPYRAW